MAQRARTGGQRTAFPRARTFGPAAVSARQRFAFIWSRESLLRLVLSLVLSIALWLYVSNKQNPDVAQDFGQPLQISTANVPDGLTLLNENLGYVYVRYRRSDPNTVVTFNSFHPFIDLTGLGPGRHRVKVQVLADPGIDVLQKQPASVSVYLQQKIYRRVKVHANIISRPPVGYGWTIKTSPSIVTVSGPGKLVPQVTRATFDLDLSSIKSTFSGVYRLRPENSQGSMVTGRVELSPSQIHVTIAIQASSSYKSLPVLAPLSGEPKAGYGVVGMTVDPPLVTVTGSPKRLSRISTIKTRPVSVSRRGAGTIVTRTRLVLEKGISSRTKYVTVRTRLAPVEASSSFEIAVEPVGVAYGLVAHVQPDRVLGTVVGPATQVAAAGASMRAVVNLAGYGVGTYTFTPTVTASSGVHLEAIYPQTVTVTVAPATP